MDQRREQLGADRHGRLFAPLKQSNDDSTSTGTPERQVHEVSSSGDESVELAEGSHAAGKATPSTPRRKRARKNNKKEFQQSPSRLQKPTTMAESSGRKGIPIDPYKPSFDIHQISSSSTRSSTNHGRSTGAYNNSAIKGAYGPVDRGFDNNEPGFGRQTSGQKPPSSRDNKQNAVPIFRFQNNFNGPPGRQIDPLSRHVDKENHSQPLRPGRTTGNHESDSGAHTAAVDQLMRSVRPGLHIAGRAGELLQGSQTQSLSKAPSTSTGSLPTASISRSSTIKDSSPSFMNLIPTSSTPHATLDKGKGKAKEGVVIELDDDSSDHDSIKDDSDSSSRPVQTSRASNRARMNSAQGSSASRNIPSGNTQAKQAIFESTSRGQGTTIHQKPPSHSLNASPDSFSLEPQRKPKTLVSGMLSSRSSSTQRGKPKKPAVPDLHALPMNRVLTQDGTYYPGPAGLELVVCSDKESPYFAIQGECLTAKRGQPNKPNISDVVINPSHIQSITAPSDYGAALTFLRIDIDEEADLSDPASPRSPFYYFQISARGVVAELDEKFDPVKRLIKHLGKTNTIDTRWVSNKMVDVLRMEASTQAKLAREDDRDAKSKDYNSDRIRATGSWVADSRRQGDTRDLPILAHNHQLESLHGEEPPLVVGTATGKARPKARPSATSDPPNSVSGPHLRQRTTATTSSTTLSSSEDSSTDSGIDLSKGRNGKTSGNGKNLRDDSAQVNDSAHEAGPPKSKINKRRSSDSPELTPDKAPQSSGLRQTRLSKANAKSRIKTSLDDSDEELPATAEPWKGCLYPEEETALVFPREGTGAVTVINSDINRLAPGEFLNDTLIEYGMKRIWQRIRDSDPSYADSIHMFSSFFYKKLSTRDRKSKIEPYKTVRKWTSKTNIFEKKFIFVPINEYFHWYLAIIVNPGRVLEPPPPPIVKAPSVKRTTRSSEENGGSVDIVPHKPAEITTSRFFSSAKDEAEANQKVEEGLNKLLASDVRDAEMVEDLPEPELPDSDRSRTGSPDAMAIDGHNQKNAVTPAVSEDSRLDPAKSEMVVDAEVTRTASTSRFSSHADSVALNDRVNSLKLDAAPSAAIPELDDNRCYIITLDSLHSKHFNVIQNLKNYLISEAKDKGHLPKDAQVPLNEADGIFRGMAAAVPQQPNMSDCGLYVLHFTEVFLQNVTELLPILVTKVKKAPEDTNKRWHYERAEKKRALFYEELVEESKEWKEWRTKKLAEKASEAEEDQLDVESDDEEDVEVVQQVQNAQSPERPPRKGKLRRYSGTEGEDSDAAAVSVTSEKRYATPPPPGQRNGARTSGVVVEVPSPSRQRTKEREQLLQVGTAQAEETKSAAKNASSEHPLKGSGTNKTSAASLTNAIPDEVTNMVFQADEAIAQRQSLTQTGQSGRDLSSNMTPQGVSVKQSLPQPGPVTTLDDDSGSEDSRAEVTDDDAAQDGQTRFRPASQPSERGQPDLQEDSFRAEMISPVPQSQEGRARGSSGLSLESSLEEIQPDLSLYHIQHPAPGPKDSNSITVKKVKEVLGEKAKEVLGEKAPLHKRQHSRDSDGPSSPSKMETSHTSKRSRTDASVPRHAPYNPSRRIMQSPSPELEDPRDTHQRSQQPSGRTNHLPGGTHHPPSISNRPASSSGGRHIHHISDGEPDIIEVSDRSSTNASQPFSSQPVKHSIREKLQRPRWP